MNRFLGTIQVWSNGGVRWSESSAVSPAMTLDELELVFRALTGAEAAMDKSENVISLAASVLAKAGAQRRLEKTS